MFGVLSTVVCFVILSLTTIAAFQWNWIYKFAEHFDESDEHSHHFHMLQGSGWTHTQVNIPSIEVSLLCAMLCSSDIIAAVSLVKYKEYPKIFSILLGEGLWNDAVAVVLA